MVLAYHSIFTVRGFWLPNDERGSWSDYIRSYELLKFGKATKIDERHSVAHRSFDREKRDKARASLKYGVIELNGIQARAVARGFAKAVAESGYVILACSIMPDHTHQVIARQEGRLIEKIVGHLKTRATQELIAEGIHPLQSHREKDGEIPAMWVKYGWNVYLNLHEDISRAVEYVENNPVKAGFKKQSWGFVGAHL